MRARCGVIPRLVDTPAAQGLVLLCPNPQLHLVSPSLLIPLQALLTPVRADEPTVQGVANVYPSFTVPIHPGRVHSGFPPAPYHRRRKSIRLDVALTKRCFSAATCCHMLPSMRYPMATASGNRQTPSASPPRLHPFLAPYPVSAAPRDSPDKRARAQRSSELVGARLGAQPPGISISSWPRRGWIYAARRYPPVTTSLGLAMCHVSRRHRVV